MEIGDEVEIKNILVGKIKPKTFGNSASAYCKAQIPSKTQISLTKNGLFGDESATKGLRGADRAINHFPQSSYAILKQKFPEHENSLQIGGFAENFSTEEESLSERNVCIGDRFQVGEKVILEVSQPRKPCLKVNKFHEAQHLTRFCLVNGISGLFFLFFV